MSRRQQPSEQLPDQAAWLSFGVTGRMECAGRTTEGDPSMSTPMISALVVGMVTAAGVPVVSVSAVAAELVPPAVAHVRHQHLPLGVALVVAFT